MGIHSRFYISHYWNIFLQSFFSNFLPVLFYILQYIEHKIRCGYLPVWLLLVYKWRWVQVGLSIKKLKKSRHPLDLERSLCNRTLTSPSASGLKFEPLQDNSLTQHTGRRKKFPWLQEVVLEKFFPVYWQLLCRILYGFPDSINGSVFCMPQATGLWLLLISFKTPHPQLCFGYLQTGSVLCSLPTITLGSFPEAFRLCRMQPKWKFRSLSFPFLSLQELFWLLPVSPH